MTAYTHLRRTHDFAALILILLLPLLPTVSSRASVYNADSTCAVTFNVNMAKAIAEGIFEPDSDRVYLWMDNGMDTIAMVPSPNSIYSIMIPNLDPGSYFHYRFRINDTLWEEVSRSLTPVDSITVINTWWNNIPLNITRLMVDMSYIALSGNFDPEADSVMIAGNMTGGLPVVMLRDTGSLIYRKAFPMDPGAVAQYKFRINAGAGGEELQGQPDRMLYIRDTIVEASHFFNNYNPARLPMTFHVDMSYYIAASHFDKNSDLVDVAGNFNNNGNNDVLFDPDNDSIYSLVVFIDTTYLHSGPLTFKYRINGSWNLAELQNKPAREYILHDTTGSNPNSYSAWYNDLNPFIPTPPWAYNLAIQGKLINHKIVTGSYTYENVNGIPEGVSVYQWYRCNDSIGTGILPIDTAWRINYQVDTTDIGKWLVFEVKPIASSGDSATGKPVRVISGSKVGGVGIGEPEGIAVQIYPNPASDVVTVKTSLPVSLVEILDLNGRRLEVYSLASGNLTRFNISHLPSGFYLLRVSGKEGTTGTGRLLRR